MTKLIAKNQYWLVYQVFIDYEKKYYSLIRRHDGESLIISEEELKCLSLLLDVV